MTCCWQQHCFAFQGLYRLNFTKLTYISSVSHSQKMCHHPPLHNTFQLLLHNQHQILHRCHCQVISVSLWFMSLPTTSAMQSFCNCEEIYYFALFDSLAPMTLSVAGEYCSASRSTSFFWNHLRFFFRRNVGSHYCSLSEVATENKL